MTPNVTNFSDRLWPWAQQNWEMLAALLVILILAIALRRWLVGGRTSRPAAKQPERERSDSQALDVSVAAAAEIASDIEAYARALFTEDMGALASRAQSAAGQPLRLVTIAEAPFIYDGVIMRDLTLMPTPLIAPVSNHFRQGQTILDDLRRLSQLTPPDASAEERTAALRRVATSLAAGIEKATFAADKLDAWIARNGGASDGARNLNELPVAALKSASVDRLSQRSKTYRILREQAQARLGEIDGLIEAARRASGPGGKLDTTLIALRPDDRRAANPPAPDVVAVKPDDKRAAE